MKQSLPVESERQNNNHSHLNVSNASPVSQAFVDNRESTALQRQLIAKMTNSPQAIAQRKLSEQMNNSPRMLVQRQQVAKMSGGAVQRVEGEEELLQGKFNPIQRVEEEELLQGKFDVIQRVEEEELMQGKFALVQRVEEEELMQGKFDTVQRVEEEEPLQGKFDTVQRVEEEELMQGKFDTAQLEQAPAEKANNTGLPDNLKQGIENLSGMSMDNVKVHYNSSKPAQLNALAYAQGTDIHLGAGQEKHLPHEAWHVVQQAQGRVKPTMQMKDGVPVNDDQALEHEADVMGAKALQMKSTEDASFTNKNTVVSNAAIQMESNVPGAVTQGKFQHVLQMKPWGETEETSAQQTLGPMDNAILEVPIKDLLDQQAWAGLDHEGGSVHLGGKNRFNLLQPIDARKVVNRAAQILAGTFIMTPPPVAFVTRAAKTANMKGLVLLDSHHTINASRIINGDKTVKVKHIAKPDLLGAATIADIAKSRAAITRNRAKAKKYNQTEKGIAALQQATSEVLKLQIEAAKDLNTVLRRLILVEKNDLCDSLPEYYEGLKSKLALLKKGRES